MSTMFRSRSVMITTALYESCKAFAELHSMSCPDEAACLLIGQRLESEPGFSDLASIYKRHIGHYREEAMARLASKQQPDTDNIPE